MKLSISALLVYTSISILARAKPVKWAVFDELPRSESTPLLASHCEDGYCGAKARKSRLSSQWRLKADFRSDEEYEFPSRRHFSREKVQRATSVDKFPKINFNDDVVSDNEGWALDPKKQPRHVLFDPYLFEPYIKNAYNGALLQNETLVRKALGNATDKEYDMFMGLYVFPKNLRHLSPWSYTPRPTEKDPHPKPVKIEPLIVRQEYWLEALDRNHFSGLDKYFAAWKKSQSPLSFFEWFYNKDEKPNLKSRPRSVLKKFKIRYITNDTERVRNHQVVFKDGLFRYVNNGTLVNTGTSWSFLHPWIFVMDPFKRLFVGKKHSGHFQHTSFTAGAPVLAAGQIYIRDGVLKFLAPWTGHYPNRVENMEFLISELENAGVRLKNARIIKSFPRIVATFFVRFGNAAESRKMFVETMKQRWRNGIFGGKSEHIHSDTESTTSSLRQDEKGDQEVALFESPTKKASASVSHKTASFEWIQEIRTDSADSKKKIRSSQLQRPPRPAVKFDQTTKEVSSDTMLKIRIRDSKRLTSSRTQSPKRFHIDDDSDTESSGSNF